MRSHNSTLNLVSDKQKKELKLRAKIKAQLIETYGNHCMTCKDKYRDFRGISLSHKIALSQGGKTDMKNCILECYVCHDKYEKKNYLRPSVLHHQNLGAL